MRILLADDHDIVRRGLRDQLTSREGWEVCGEATNGREAVAMALKLKPDVVVLDLSMPELNGLEATRQIRRELPRTEVLIFTMHETEQLIREVLAAGARGYVLKSDAGRHLTSAVEALSHHKPFFTAKVSEALLDAFLKSNVAPDEGSVFRTLTDREREIVQMLAEGKSNKEIASKLSISVKTVETHRATVMRKLEINSIVELVHYAIRNQLVEA
ncbi:MAG TPA: response regulator transcription factor [Pyrinomonadaceae bacterium]|jgi:DNA-binding NarL/FixJ family response regulator|nr:response regulator transcription factor [Pyrinomonadaceae bacterium]